MEVIRLDRKTVFRTAVAVERDHWRAARPNETSSRRSHQNVTACFTEFWPALHFSVSHAPPADLHARINARVDAMFARGLVDETRELLKRGLAENKTAMQAIGYRQVVEHLRGERSLAETIELVKIRTRQFAKRQLTWFRAQKNLEWIELKPYEPAEKCAQKICETI